MIPSPPNDQSHLLLGKNELSYACYIMGALDQAILANTKTDKNAK